MGVFKIPVERKSARPETISLMRFAENTQFCSRPTCSLVFYARALLQSHRGEDSTRMGNYEKCPHFLFPISILVGGNYNLLRNTQNINGAMWKDITVTDLQPQSVTSKYWCGKGFLFRKAVETTKPTQVRTLAGASALHPRCCAKLCWAGGRPCRPHMEPTFCANLTKRWHIQQAERGNPVKRGNWEHKARSWNQGRKPSLWGMQRQGYARRTRQCLVSSLCPPSGTSPWPDAWITRGWHASAAS